MNAAQAFIAVVMTLLAWAVFRLMRNPETRRPQFQQWPVASRRASLLGAAAILLLGVLFVWFQGMD
jgi:hypothetical protein